MLEAKAKEKAQSAQSILKEAVVQKRRKSERIRSISASLATCRQKIRRSISSVKDRG